MTLSVNPHTLILSKPKAENPLDVAVHEAGRKLQCFLMTRLCSVAQPTKSEAQSLVRDLLDISKVVDDMLLAIGREARAHFGHGVELELFTDQLLGAIQGNATYVVEEAAEEIERDADDARDDYYDRRFYAA